MAESAKLLVDDVLGGYPIRQWVVHGVNPAYTFMSSNTREAIKKYCSRRNRARS